MIYNLVASTEPIFFNSVHLCSYAFHDLVDLFVGRLPLRVRHAPRHDADKGGGTRPLLPVARQSGHLGSALLDT